MLTDLCPEEKLKVGQLIKINEERKIQIEELQEECSILKSRLVDWQNQFSEVEQTFKVKQEESILLESQLARMKEEAQFKQKFIEKLTSQNKELL